MLVYITYLQTRRVGPLNSLKFWFYRDVKFGFYGDVKHFVMTKMVSLGLLTPFEEWECPEKCFDLDF